MPRRSHIDKRSKNTRPRQCVSDYGMHKDASRRDTPLVPETPCSDSGHGEGLVEGPTIKGDPDKLGE